MRFLDTDTKVEDAIFGRISGSKISGRGRMRKEHVQ
jgi:hypothetical protein